MSPPDLTPAPGQKWDDYCLIRFLGRGGFGEVWLCRSGGTGSYHALKFISGKDLELLEREHHSLTLYRDPAIREGIDRMCQWINEANGTFKAGVDAVHEAMNAGEVDGLVSLLLTESGVNILRAMPN